MKQFFILIASLAGISASLALDIPINTVNTPVERQLKAATPQSYVAARSNSLHLKNRFDLHYVEDQIERHDAMGARMELQSHGHSLILEEIEHLVREIHCTDDAKLNIRFRSEHYDAAKSIMGEVTDLFIITSHKGCNQPGSRMPYRAVEMNVIDENQTVQVSLGDACWKKDFGMRIRFGPVNGEKYSLNRHEHLAPASFKREIFAKSSSPPSLSSIPVSVSSTVPPQSSIQFPTPTITEQVSATSVSDDISFSLQNAQLLPPSLDNITVGIPLHNTGITISCIDCHATGTISLVSGYFSTGGNTSEHFLSDGFVELAANGVTAHVALDVNWQPTISHGVPIALGKIPLTPFAIPGVANVGATFIPNIIFSANVGSNVDFQYGFSVVVPNNATATAAFGSARNSSILGFENTTIDALPFNSKTNNVSMTLSATLQPEILLGITLLEENAGAAIFLNLPQLSLSISEVTGVNDHCEPSNNSASAHHISQELGNLTHVVPAAELAAGFVIEASKVGQTAYTPFATTFAMPTACLAYHTQGSSYGPAVAALASATSTSAAPAKTSNAGSTLRLTAVKGDSVLNTVTRWQGLIIALCTVFGSFAVL